DKKHNVLFTDTECLILLPEFKIVDENLVLLRAPRKNDVYSLNLKSIIPSGGVTCLVTKASEDEAILWHRRLGHVNFKNINKLVKSNLVRGLPSKTFKHDHSCLACRKGKQHKASCKKLEEKTVREPLELLHMDLFGPVSVESLNRKKKQAKTKSEDHESTICIVKNPVFHSKTKHIQIRHHFIRDCYDQRLINVVKVHTDDNVADLLTKGFDLARFNSLVVNIGMMNPYLHLRGGLLVKYGL
ncbi:putative ribonuclease H-like domain-containing protein, partial [Tanacetum coccineum]